MIRESDGEGIVLLELVGTITGIMKRLSIMSVTVFAVSPLTSALAQEQLPPLEPGARVRVTAPDLGIDELTGRFEALRGDTLAVVVGAADLTMTFPLASLTRLEVSRGRKSHVVRGAVLGGVIGAVVGVAFAFVAVSAACETAGGCTPEAGEVLIGVAIIGVPGLAIGAIAGALTKTDQWEEVPLDALRVSVAPQRDGRFAVGLSVRF